LGQAPVGAGWIHVYSRTYTAILET
jgi:hypothetical protein